MELQILQAEPANNNLPGDPSPDQEFWIKRDMHVFCKVSNKLNLTEQSIKTNPCKPVLVSVIS